MHPHYANGTNQLLMANTAIGIENLSPKQLLGECVDLGTQLFKELLMHHLNVTNLESVFQSRKVDFAALVGYIVDPSRLDSILDKYVKGNDKATKALAKSWIFELRSYRNMWAHSDKVEPRLSVRAFETLSLLYWAFEGDTKSELFTKIQFYRKTLQIIQAKSYVQ